MPYFTRSGTCLSRGSLQPHREFLLGHDLLDAAADEGELLVNGRKGNSTDVFDR
jgi:hypothetical protein